MRSNAPMLVALIVLMSTSASASESVLPPLAKSTLLVFDLVAERGVDEGLSRLLNELLLTEFSKSKRYNVVGGSDLVSMLDAESQRQLVGCDNTECLAAIGGALGAQFLATASVGRVGDGFLLNVKLLDSRGGNVLKRSSQEVDGDEKELLDAVRRTVALIIAETPAPAHSASGGRRWPWLIGVGGIAAAVTGVVLIAIRDSESSIRENQYADYLAAQPADRDARYSEVRGAVDRHNALTVGGGVLIGAGVAAVGASLVGLLVSDEPPPASLSVTPGSAALRIRWNF